MIHSPPVATGQFLILGSASMDLLRQSSDFVIENLLAVAHSWTLASFYRTAAGAEIDLVLELPGRTAPWAIEIKHSLAPRPTRGFHHALEDVRPEKAFVVYAGTERYPLSWEVEVIGVREMAEVLCERRVAGG